MANWPSVSTGFLSRIRNDRRGNTLAIVAAAMIPLLGVVGGGIDMGRYYLTKSRLQNACDAAVLAGRQSMTGVTWASADETKARNFFNTNFPSGSLGSSGSSIAFSVNSAGAVTGTATVTSPATIMRLFGVGNKPFTAVCRAELQLPNSDVMFVLDTTLSMTETNPGDSQSRLVGMRGAVQNFYTRLEAAKAAGTQLRYGFVPYSSTVNVGLLLKREWMADQWTYQSREGNSVEEVPGATDNNVNTTTIDTSGPWTGSLVTTTVSVQSESCSAPANTISNVTNWNAWTPNSGSVPRERTGTQTQNGTTYGTPSRNATTGICSYSKNVYTDYSRSRYQKWDVNPNYGNTGAPSYRYWYNYLPRQITVSSLKGSAGTGLMAGGTVVVPNIDADTTNKVFKSRTITWGSGTVGACIEERQTLRPGETGTAYDMDVDMVPNIAMPETQWRPAIPGLIYARSISGTGYYPTNGSAITGWTYPSVIKTTTGFITPSSYPTDFAACPTTARKLSTITAAQLTTYLTSLKAAGRTYHDIGFLWGLRLLSAQGLFASENTSAPNGGSIARHLIFMTDGATETNIADYDAYGLAALDRRRTANPTTTLPTDAGQNAIVEDRLSRLCTVAKSQKNVTVWVIAFGTTLTDLLKDCATSRDYHAFQANNTAQLEDAFDIIAGKIAQLRLTE